MHRQSINESITCMHASCADTRREPYHFSNIPSLQQSLCTSNVTATRQSPFETVNFDACMHAIPPIPQCIRTPNNDNTNLLPNTRTCTCGMHTLCHVHTESCTTHTVFAANSHRQFPMSAITVAASQNEHHQITACAVHNVNITTQNHQPQIT